MTASIFLAFLATAGLFYVNIMPALVNGLIDALGFSNQQAGAIGSANMYGAAIGALTIVFVIKRLRWKLAAVVFLAGLITIDLISMLISDASTLMMVRFVHGLVGGMLVGTSFAIIARTTNIDRTFGVLLFVQFGLGGLGVMLLPGLVPVYGTPVLFFALIAFSVVTLLMLPFLPDYPIKPKTGHAAGDKFAGIDKPNLLLTLLAIFTFQGANMGLYAFIIGLGKHYGLAAKFDASGQMAALGGFASKMGLASGPVVAAWLLGENSYPRLIIVAVIILFISAFLAWKPARKQDQTMS